MRTPYTKYLIIALCSIAGTTAAANFNITARDITNNAFSVGWQEDPSFEGTTTWETTCVPTGDMPTGWTLAADTFQIASGLNSETSYDLYVRATNGGGDSDTDMITVTTLTNPNPDLQICNGTDTETHYPLFGNYTDVAQRTQSIYLANQLTSIKGKKITSLHYNINKITSSAYAWNDRTFNVKLGTTTRTNLSNGTLVEGLTTVYSGKLSYSQASGMTISLSTPFVYEGGNLVVEIELPASSTGYQNVIFVGQLQDNVQSLCIYNNGKNQKTSNFVPEITLHSEEVSYPIVNHLIVDKITYNNARAHWYPGGNESLWNYVLSTEALSESELELSAAQSTDKLINSLSNLQKDTDYFLYVQADYQSDNKSKWTDKIFTTPPSCSAPQFLEAVIDNNNGVTLSATPGIYGSVGDYDFRYWIEDSQDTITLSNQNYTCSISNLQTETTYLWQARIHCSEAGEGDSRWTDGLPFHTCGTLVVDATHSYEQNFDTEAFVTPCWTNEHVAGTDTRVWTASYTQKHGPVGASAQLEDMEDGNVVNLATPLISIPKINEYEVKFWVYRSDSYNQYEQEGIKVFVNATPDTLGATRLAYIRRSYLQEPAVAQPGWYQYSAPIPAMGNVYLIFQGVSEYGDHLYLDDISVSVRPAYAVSTQVGPFASMGSVTMACAAEDSTSTGRIYEHKAITLTASAQEGFWFKQWESKNAPGVALYNQAVWPINDMVSDTSVIAVFDTLQYQLNVKIAEEAGQGRLGTVTGSGSYKHSTLRSFSASPVAHCYPLWSDGSTEAQREVLMPMHDTTFVVSFEIDQHQVAVSINDASLGEAEGAGTYNWGSAAVLRAKAKNNARFTGWSNGQTATDIVVTIDGDTSLTANFEALPCLLVVGSDSTWHQSLQKAISKAGNQTATVVLLAPSTESINVGQGDITIDLNGYTLDARSEYAIVCNTKLTISDLSQAQTGVVLGNKGVYVMPDGELRLTDTRVISCSGYDIENHGTCWLLDGTESMQAPISIYNVGTLQLGNNADGQQCALVVDQDQSLVYGNLQKLDIDNSSLSAGFYQQDPTPYIALEYVAVVDPNSKLYYITDYPDLQPQIVPMYKRWNIVLNVSALTNLLNDLGADSLSIDPNKVRWYKAVGEVDVLGRNGAPLGDDTPLNTGFYHTEGVAMTGLYYAVVEIPEVEQVSGTRYFRSNIVSFEAAQGDEEDTRIYDLSGRPASENTRGVVVRSNGLKELR